MRIDRFVAWCGLFLLAWLPALNVARADAENPGRKPNILLIVADDLGYGEMGCQGWKDIPTPQGIGKGGSEKGIGKGVGNEWHCRLL